MTTNNFCFYLQNRLIQTSQIGGQWFNDTSPLSIPCFDILQLVKPLTFTAGNTKGGKYQCTIDLLFDSFGISCTTTDNFCFYLQNILIQTSQIGGQWFNDTPPLSIPCFDILQLVKPLTFTAGNTKGGLYH
jgi:hypothetical protein